MKIKKFLTEQLEALELPDDLAAWDRKIDIELRKNLPPTLTPASIRDMTENSKWVNFNMKMAKTFMSYFAKNLHPYHTVLKKDPVFEKYEALELASSGILEDPSIFNNILCLRAWLQPKRETNSFSKKSSSKI